MIDKFSNLFGSDVSKAHESKDPIVDNRRYRAKQAFTVSDGFEVPEGSVITGYPRRYQDINDASVTREKIMDRYAEKGHYPVFEFEGGFEYAVIPGEVLGEPTNFAVFVDEIETLEDGGEL